MDSVGPGYQPANSCGFEVAKSFKSSNSSGLWRRARFGHYAVNHFAIGPSN
jgi:hypothetical protein